jgi:hypothetical protein
MATCFMGIGTPCLDKRMIPQCAFGDRAQHLHKYSLGPVECECAQHVEKSTNARTHAFTHEHNHAHTHIYTHTLAHTSSHMIGQDMSIIHTCTHIVHIPSPPPPSYNKYTHRTYCNKLAPPSHHFEKCITAPDILNTKIQILSVQT